MKLSGVIASNRIVTISLAFVALAALVNSASAQSSGEGFLRLLEQAQRYCRSDRAETFRPDRMRASATNPTIQSSS